jgi:hypothetical protein
MTIMCLQTTVPPPQNQSTTSMDTVENLCTDNVNVNKNNVNLSANPVNPGVKNSSITARRKRFRFAPETSQVVGRVLCRDDLSEEEKSSYWWTKEKKHKFRSAANLVIQTTRANTGSSPRNTTSANSDDSDSSSDTSTTASHKDMINLIDYSYKLAKNVSSHFGKDAMDELFADPSVYTRRLETWSCANNGPEHNEHEHQYIHMDAYGLERMVSKVQQLERRADHVCIRRHVVNMSRANHQSSQSQTSPTSLTNITPSYSVEEIAQVANRLSLTSRVYARMVGHAEAHVIMHHDDDDDDNSNNNKATTCSRCCPAVPPPQVQALAIAKPVARIAVEPTKTAPTNPHYKTMSTPKRSTAWRRLLRLGKSISISSIEV